MIGPNFPGININFSKKKTKGTTKMITFFMDDTELLMKISGNNFYDLMTVCTENYVPFNKEIKAYSLKKRNKVKGVLEQLLEIELFEIPDYVKEYMNIKVETKFKRNKIIPEFFEKLPAIKGKTPYENFQVDDIKRGLNQSRIEFAHEMGCFTGDMKIKTNEGFKSFNELYTINDGLFTGIDDNGIEQKMQVVSSRYKDIIILYTDKGGQVICTPDHIFRDVDNKEIEAIETLWKKVEMVDKDGQKLFDRVNRIVICQEQEPCFDFKVLESENHWGIVQGFIVHNCGKTYISMQVINHRIAYKDIDKIFILAPNEATVNWKVEFLRFALFPVNEEDIYIVSAENRLPFESNPKVIICSYRSLIMLADDSYFKAKKKKSTSYKTSYIPFDNWGSNDKRLLLMDESHYIKNKESRRTELVEMIKNKFEYRIAMTGTPHPNGLEELWSQMNVLDEGIIKQDYVGFINRIALVGNQWNKNAVVDYKETECDNFIKEIKPWYIRRYSKDVLDLPELILKKYYCEMSEKQKKLYQAYIQFVLRQLADKNNGDIEFKKVVNSFPTIVVMLHNPCVLKKREDLLEDAILSSLIKTWKFTDHPKVEIVTDLTRKYIEEENQKVILWSTHPDTIKEFEKLYKNYNPLVLYGEVDKKDRPEIINEFKKDKERKLLIANQLVLNTNATINECRRNIYFDRNYDLTIWLQSQKRTHRIGQTESVIVAPIITNKSIETSQDAVLEKRKDFNEDITKYKFLSREQMKKVWEGATLF